MVALKGLFSTITAKETAPDMFDLRRQRLFIGLLHCPHEMSETEKQGSVLATRDT